MKKRKVGAFVGKFYPAHIGHLSVIDNMVKKLDKLYIVISKNNIRNKTTLNDFKYINAGLIKRWFKKHYSNNNKIFVEIFDESNLKPYPQDTDKWAKKFKKQFPDVNIKIADESYREFNQKYFSECEFWPIDRDVIPIHSTQIRNNILENINYIIPEAQAYYKRKLSKNKKGEN